MNLLTVFPCQCGHSAHMLKLDYDTESDLFEISFQLNPWFKWYKRIWYSLLYIFKKDVPYGLWDTIILDRAGVESLTEKLIYYKNNSTRFKES